MAVEPLQGTAELSAAPGLLEMQWQSCCQRLLLTHLLAPSQKLYALGKVVCTVDVLTALVVFR